MKPALGLSAIRALVAGFRAFLVEPEHRLDVQQTERFAIAVGAHRQREMTEEPLPRSNEPPQPHPRDRAAELKLGRVMDDEYPLVGCCPSSRLAKVRRQDGVGRDFDVAEKTIRTLELRLVKRL